MLNIVHRCVGKGSRELLQKCSRQLLRNRACSTTPEILHGLDSSSVSGKNNNDISNSTEGEIVSTEYRNPNVFLQKQMDEAVHFLANMSESEKHRKQEIETLMYNLKESDIDARIPLQISAIGWKVLLTEHHSFHSRRKYLEFLCVNEWKRDIQSEKSEKKREKKASQETLISLTRYRKTWSLNEVYRPKILRRHLASNAFLHGHPFIIDFDFDHTNSTMEMKKTKKQIDWIYGKNLNHCEPFKLHFTGYQNKPWIKDDIEYGNWGNYLVDKHEGSFMDLFPKEKLVYLSPDGPPLRNFVPSDIYIMGGMVDLKDTSPVSMAKAKRLGIRHYSLPLSDYCRLANKTLTLDCVLRIMLHLQLTNDIGGAIRKNLPERFIYNQERIDKAHKRKIEHVYNTIMAGNEMLERDHNH